MSKKSKRMLGDEQVFSTFEVLDIVDIKKDRLMQWMRRGDLPAGRKDGYGGRTRTLFTLNEVCSIALFKILLDRGVDRKSASKMMTEVAWVWNEIKEPRFLIVLKGEEGFYSEVCTESEIEFLLVKIAAIYVNFTELRMEIESRGESLKSNPFFGDEGRKQRNLQSLTDLPHFYEKNSE